MRECFSDFCYKGKEVVHLEDGTEYGKELVTDKDCPQCEGTGFVEDGCYCSARCSCECSCGAWDDITCFCWE